MGIARPPLPVKLIIGALTSEPELVSAAVAALKDGWGRADHTSERLPFEHTAYYEAEFGRGLERVFVAFRDLVDPGQLAAIKRTTNDLERRFTEGSHRRINLDPGYISAAKLVLATTKNHGHRIYIGQGIYAEVTLTYHDKAFRTLPWTYPDYATDAYREIFESIRKRYLEQLRALDRSGALDREELTRR